MCLVVMRNCHKAVKTHDGHTYTHTHTYIHTYTHTRKTWHPLQIFP